MSQNYANHKRFHPIFHFLVIPVITLCLIVSLYACYQTQNPVYALVFLSFFLLLLIGIMARTFALKVQDRAIRAEESLRYFILARKPLPSDLQLGQILAIRFASDEEYLSLIDHAIAKHLSPDEIKKAIKNWREDDHRI